MKSGNTFWKIYFLLLPFSLLGLSPGPGKPDYRMAFSFLQSVLPFYQSKHHGESALKYFSLVDLRKVYHSEAVTFVMSVGKRLTTHRYPVPENMSSNALVPGFMSILIQTEISFNIIFHHLELMDLTKEWFNQYQF